ncbi:helix-turn-helix domain-containing protein [Streptomyces sp. NBC_01190]|uniref:helix-turn-helix domain-containing protein n=1 Tax=Streptomyces sp. NBC_01190 TaxID=2903767 RepID=UPI00386D7DC0|nr:helix-turn-helix domain-containing protein [Streptomyces sp. NBC_01190]
MSIGNSPSDDRPSVGRALAQARIAAGLSIDEVSTTTRVRVPILQAIEQDDFSRCGGDVYARGHIRTIARVVGIDPEPLVERYVAEHVPASDLAPVAPLYEAERIRSEPRRPNWTAAMIAAIVAVVGFVGYTAVKGGGDSGVTAKSTPTSPAATTTKPGATPRGNGVPKPPQASGSAIAAAPPGKVTVKASAASGASWIQATDSNGKQLYQDSLKKGQSVTWTDDKKIKLIVGNAGAVQLFVNGKDIGRAGGKGEVAHLTYTPGDPTQG